LLYASSRLLSDCPSQRCGLPVRQQPRRLAAVNALRFCFSARRCPVLLRDRMLLPGTPEPPLPGERRAVLLLCGPFRANDPRPSHSRASQAAVRLVLSLLPLWSKRLLLLRGQGSLLSHNHRSAYSAGSEYRHRSYRAGFVRTPSACSRIAPTPQSLIFEISLRARCRNSRACRAVYGAAVAILLWRAGQLCSVP